jgi:hypothetical protein|tara:strand:+ start:605 stop:814 length:210 start_codon:yes stop_codon:yes gene_type:complete
MEQVDIDILLKAGLWVSVSPIMSNGEWVWTCGVYKKRKRTGTWVTESCKTFKNPAEGYEWALQKLLKKI